MIWGGHDCLQRKALIHDANFEAYPLCFFILEPDFDEGKKGRLGGDSFITVTCKSFPSGLVQCFHSNVAQVPANSKAPGPLRLPLFLSDCRSSCSYGPSLPVLAVCAGCLLSRIADGERVVFPAILDPFPRCLSPSV